MEYQRELYDKESVCKAITDALNDEDNIFLKAEISISEDNFYDEIPAGGSFFKQVSETNIKTSITIEFEGNVTEVFGLVRKERIW